jgi:hypothetical protein
MLITFGIKYIGRNSPKKLVEWKRLFNAYYMVPLCHEEKHGVQEYQRVSNSMSITTSFAFHVL